MLGMTTTSDPGMTGFKDIADALGGGIRENSLVFIEGAARTGKSILSQHIACGVLHYKDSAVAYYSYDYNSETLLEQMNSMSLDVRHDLVTDRFRVYKMGTPFTFKGAEKSLKIIIRHIMALPFRFKLIIIDSPSPYLIHLNPMYKLDFLDICKQLATGERSIILTLDSHVFENNTQIRAFEMSDYYLRLKSQDMMLEKGHYDTRIIKSLEIIKLGGAERWGAEPCKFEIKPGVGIQILPLMRIRV
jgi:archaellum biogenesis ATPase FlaH